MKPARLVCAALAALVVIGAPRPTAAQTGNAWVVTACGAAPPGFGPPASPSPPYTVGNQAPVTQNPDGQFCINSGGSGNAPYQETYLGRQDLTLTTAVAITPTTGATIADIVADGGNTVNVFCWADGGTPSASSGIPIGPLGSWRVISAALSSVKCFAASSATLHIEFGR